MTFKSDFKALRTWDPDTGWELFKVTIGPDYPSFELRHPNEESINFWGKILSIESIDGLTPLGHKMSHKVFEVVAVNGRPGALASARERQLIEAALLAHGAFHNGPAGPVDVTYSA